MMTALSAKTLYKTLKQNGNLSIPKDGKAVLWTPDQPAGAPPSLTIPVQDVSNLQKTPETAKKAMLKIFAKPPSSTDAVDHTFTFTSADARIEIETVTDHIRRMIDDHKKQQLAAASTGPGQSAAMTIANAVSGHRTANVWEDDDRLKTDVRLQQSLMQADPQLQKTFMEALSVKPDSITNLQFTQQFWASRVHLLRAHALAQHQDRGKSNVFSDIGVVGSGKTVSITSEQIHTIFEQYPLLRRVYDELVPKRYNEASFWKRFFQSQLYLNLRGMKTDDRINRKDEYIDSDQYLNAPELTGLRPTAPELHIPKFFDLEGNEENHSQRKGNKPDNENNQANLEKAPVIRKLNALSEKLMAAVRQSDVDVSAPIGTMEAEYEMLRLRDLEGDPEQQRIVLNIRDQRRFFSDNQSSATEGNPFKNVDQSKAIRSAYKDLTKSFPNPGSGALPIAPFEASEHGADDESEPTANGATHAHIQLMKMISAHRSLTAPIAESSGLDPQIYERITLTHATSIEFLRQFWSAFLSGDSGRANEIAALVDSLTRATERILAIASDADSARVDFIHTLEKQEAEKARLTGERPKRVNRDAVPRGGKIVKELMRPILDSLRVAEQAYRRAYSEQVGELDNNVGTPEPRAVA
jgi:transcription initiation factor TFIIH subunit 1